MKPEEYGKHVKRFGDLNRDSHVLSSSALSDTNQVFYANDLSSALSNTMDLSVRYVTQDQFHGMVVGDPEYAGLFEPKTLYIVSSDEINAYNTNIKNVADPLEDKDAANKWYVDDAARKIDEDVGLLSDELQYKLDKRTGGEVSGDVTILSGNYIQTTDEVDMYGGKNAFIQANTYNATYGKSSVGSKGFYVLSVIGTNKLKLSGSINIPRSAYSKTWSVSLDDKLDSQFSTISSVDGQIVTFASPFDSLIQAKSISSESQLTSLIAKDDNAFYCPIDASIGNVVLNFYGQHAEGGSVHAIAQYSHAEGRGSTAEGRYAHAEGNITTAGGAGAHAEGMSTKALGNRSHAEGESTFAYGIGAHAEGYQTSAESKYAHSEGEWTYAKAEASHAEGSYTSATANYAHAEGLSCIASGTNSHAEGYQTKANEYATHAEGFKSKALSAGAHAEGGGKDGSTIYTGGYAAGLGAHAEGRETSALGGYSHAEGFGTYAFGSFSHTAGYQTSAFRQGAYAEGYRTQALSDWSHVEGYMTSAYAECAHAEGGSKISALVGGYAKGVASHAEGVQTSAIGDWSHAEGRKSRAEGVGAHAEGGSLTYIGGYAKGVASHAEGAATHAIGSFSHAEGYQTSAFSQGTVAFGHNAYISGDWSFGGGYDLSSNAKNTVVLGINANANDLRSYVWSGIANSVPYTSHGIGTFNVNPIGGLSGFYIGEKSLNDYLISSTNALSIDNYMLTADFNELSNKIGLNRADEVNKVVTLRDISNLNGAMHFKGAYESLSDVQSAIAGDVVIISSTSKEYVYNSDEATYSSAYWVELGDESLYATKAEVSAYALKTEAASMSAFAYDEANSYTNTAITNLSDVYYNKTETSSATEIANAGFATVDEAIDAILCCGISSTWSCPLGELKYYESMNLYSGYLNPNDPLRRVQFFLAFSDDDSQWILSAGGFSNFHAIGYVPENPDEVAGYNDKRAKFHLGSIVDSHTPAKLVGVEDIILSRTNIHNIAMLDDIPAVSSYSNIYINAISSDELGNVGLDAEEKLDKFTIYKFDSLSAYNLSGSSFGILSSDIVLIDEENINAEGHRILSVASPELSDDAATKGYVDGISSSLNSQIQQLSDDLSSEISSLEDTVISNDSNLSTAIDSKIFIDGISAESLCAIHISQQDYYDLVSSDSTSSNVLYIVSSDNINAYGQRIENLAEPELSTDAATKGYVDNANANLKAKIAGSTAINALISQVDPSDGISNVKIETAISALLDLVNILSGNA